MAKQILCNRTEKRTKDIMILMGEALKASENSFLRAVGYCCHPVCWVVQRCPEIKGCGLCEPITEYVSEGRK